MAFGTGEIIGLAIALVACAGCFIHAVFWRV